MHEAILDMVDNNTDLVHVGSVHKDRAPNLVDVLRFGLYELRYEIVDVEGQLPDMDSVGDDALA